jgi:predicted nucleic-acid-binding protein
MLAVDISVVIRFLTADDPEQSRRALALVGDTPIWIGKTVLLETEWVLRSLYGFGVDQVAVAFQDLVGLPTVHVENARAVQRALEWFAAGLDFADALHFASRGRADAFVTFDNNFRKRASRPTKITIRVP